MVTAIGGHQAFPPVEWKKKIGKKAMIKIRDGLWPVLNLVNPNSTNRYDEEVEIIRSEIFLRDATAVAIYGVHYDDYVWGKKKK